MKTKSKLIDDNGKAQLYYADSPPKIVEVTDRPGIYVVRFLGLSEEGFPKTADQAIDILTEHRRDWEGLPEKYSTFKLTRQEICALMSQEIPLDERLAKFLYELAHYTPSAPIKDRQIDSTNTLTWKRYIAGLVPPTKGTEPIQRVDVVNTPKTFGRSVVEMGGIEYFCENLLASAKGFQQFKHKYDINIEALQSCGELEDKIKSKPPVHQRYPESFDWYGLEVLYPDEEQRLARIKQFHREWFPEEFIRARKGPGEFRKWIKGLRSE